MEEWSRAAKALHHELTGDFALEQGEASKAVELYTAAILNKPFNGQVLIKLGDLHAENKELEKAFYMYERARRDVENAYPTYVLHAQLLVENRRYKESIPLIESALDLDPNDSLEEFYEKVTKAASIRLE